MTADLEHLPRDRRWKEQLARRCRLGLDANAALAVLRKAWGDIAGWW